MKASLLINILLAISLASVTQSAEVCNIFCDGRDPEFAINPRQPVSVEIWGRRIILQISDSDDMAYGIIENGDPIDELWLDRSFDGGLSWDGRLGDTQIPPGNTGWRTLMFNIDNPSDPEKLGIGAMRACGKAGDRPEIVCTGWARSTINSERAIDAAATALMQFYDNRGLWTTTGWWNSANALTAIMDYGKITGRDTYNYAIDTTFEKNKDTEDGNYTNIYIGNAPHFFNTIPITHDMAIFWDVNTYTWNPADDTLWWGLAWVDAYDILGDEKYLDMAKIDADYSYGYQDYVCGGGLWWTRDMTYKNAIPNELFIKLAAALHNRIPGDTKYLHQAIEVWVWFRSSGMFNSENLINDGLDDNCQNNEGFTWSYNQGVILGGLVELFKATGDSNYISEARAIADAVLRSTVLNPNGVLYDHGCEVGGGDCGGDAPTFKGVFARNLGELDRILEERPYRSWLIDQTDSLYLRNRNSLDQYGVHWAGPFDKADAARQQSALEAYTAAY